jgi:hypothetical protein
MTRYLFIAPFRTLLNLKSDFAHDRSDALSEASRVVIERMRGQLPGHLSAPELDNQGQTRYLGLEQDDLPRFCTPIFSYACAPVERERVEQGLRALAPGTTVAMRRLSLELHDNTIGLCVCDVTLSTPDDRLTLLDDLGTAELFRSFLDDLGATTLEKLYAETRLVFRHAGVMTRRTQWSVFFDITSQAGPTGDHIPKSMLWLARVLVVDHAAEEPDRVADWTTEPSPRRMRVDDSLSLEFNIGNSVLITESQGFESAIQDVLVSLSAGQLYYSVFDIVGRNMKLLNARTSASIHSRELSAFLDQVDNAALFTRIMASDWRDLRFGIQGNRKRVLFEAATVWNMETLIANTLEKTSTASDRVSRLLGRNAIQIQRISELILTFIGGLSVIDIAFSMLTYSESQDFHPDDIPGPMDIMAALPLDMGILLSLFILVLVILLHHVLRTRK